MIKKRSVSLVCVRGATVPRYLIVSVFAQWSDEIPVTIVSVRAHGVRQLLVYCLGKREGDWPCHHSGSYRLIVSRLTTF